MRKRSSQHPAHEPSAKVRIVDSSNSGTHMPSYDVLVQEIQVLRQQVASLTEKVSSQEQELDALMNEENEHLVHAQDEYSREYRQSLAKDAAISDMRRSLSKIQSTSGSFHMSAAKLIPMSVEGAGASDSSSREHASEHNLLEKYAVLEKIYQKKEEEMTLQIKRMEGDLFQRQERIMQLVADNTVLKRAALGSSGGKAMQQVAQAHREVQTDATEQTATLATTRPKLVLEPSRIRKMRKGELIEQLDMWRKETQAPNLPIYDTATAPNKPTVLADVLQVVRKYPDGKV
ncbi:hypothetical protein EV715DRAFT_278347 [Schizophyllum commune]